MSKINVAQAVHNFFSGGLYRREVACFAAEGMGIVALFTEDNGGHVEFDFFRIWESMKKASRMPRFSWMYHTHGPGFACASTTDNNAVSGWTTALGMPIQMVVLSANTGCARYACSKGNNIVDISHIGPVEGSESFLGSVLFGLSVCPEAPTQEDLDGLAAELNAVLPVSLWDGMYIP